MVEFKIAIDEKWIPVLEALAKYEGLGSIEDALGLLLTERIEDLEHRFDDPLIGMLNSGREDVSERDEDLLYGNWKPD
jgi:hypothetical protein